MVHIQVTLKEKKVEKWFIQIKELYKKKTNNITKVKTICSEKASTQRTPDHH
jgi:hypothetical protein